MDFGLLTHIISWDIYTRFFAVLFDYGFYYLPLLILFYQNYIDLLSKDANTSISSISINRMFNSVLIYIVVFIVAVLPINSVDSLENLKSQLTPNIVNNQQTSKLNEASLKTYNTWNNNQTIQAKIPTAFAIYDIAQHVVIGGVRDIVAQLPINDIRSEIANTLQNDAIKTPAIRRNYNDFASQCFNLAKSRFDKLVASGDITPETGWLDFKLDIPQSSYDWVGGDYYLKTPGFYLPCGGSEQGICKTHNGLQFMYKDKAYSCNAGWDWLYPQLKDEFKINESVSFKEIERSLGSANAKVNKKQAIRSFLKAERVVDSEEGADWGILAALKAAVSWVVGLVGAGATAFLKIITTYLITIILPLIQALLLFVIVVILPVLLPFSAFRLDYLFSIFAALFAIQFVSVIIAVISIIDNSLLALYSANSGSDNAFMQAVHIAGSGRGFEFFLINLLILLFYLIAIKLWFGFMVEFGGNVSKQIGDSMTQIGGVSSLGGIAAGGASVGKGAVKVGRAVIDKFGGG